MNIDISNAHCGPWILFLDHSWLRVVYTRKTATYVLVWRVEVRDVTLYCVRPVLLNDGLRYVHTCTLRTSERRRSAVRRVLGYCAEEDVWSAIRTGPNGAHTLKTNNHTHDLRAGETTRRI